jgi:hypothetical protein
MYSRLSYHLTPLETALYWCVCASSAARLVPRTMQFRPGTTHAPRPCTKSSVDDLGTCRGVVLSRAATILRSIETQPSTGRFVPPCGDAFSVVAVDGVQMTDRVQTPRRSPPLRRHLLDSETASLLSFCVLKGQLWRLGLLNRVKRAKSSQSVADRRLVARRRRSVGDRCLRVRRVRHVRSRCLMPSSGVWDFRAL